MYVYTAQGKIEMFYDAADAAPNFGPFNETVKQEAQTVKQEAQLLAGKTVKQEAITKPDPRKGTLCVYVKNKSEAHGKCGKCCHDNNTYWNGTYSNINNNTFCGCDPLTTSLVSDNQFVFSSGYLNSTNTSVTYSDNLVTQETCTNKCMGDPLCSFSMFTPQKQCYNATANYRAGSKVKTPGTVVETKNVPTNVEAIFGANYKMPQNSIAENTLYNGKLSYPNCAQRCINTPGCTFAVADQALSCTVSSLPLQKATLLNDMNAATFVPQ